MLGYVWGLWDQTIGLNQVKHDWHLLSWSAKWLGAPAKDIMYKDQRKAKNIEDDSELLKGIWKLLDEADIVIGQNSKKFDTKKLNARFILNGMKPPSSYRQIDTLVIAKKHFAFTSNKLEYMSNKLCSKYKKLKTKKFQGFDLWKACLAGNPAAWKEMELYNKYDVLALEELYTKLIPWDSSINFDVYRDKLNNECRCGKGEWKRNGYFFSNAGKFQRYQCTACGYETRDKTNLLSKEKKQALTKGTIR